MTSPSLLADLPELIAKRVKVIMPQLATCKGMVGRVDVERLKSIGVASPAVLFSVVRVVQATAYAGPHVTFTAELAAFVICKDGLGAKRDELSGRIAQVLLGLIPNNVWGQPDDLGEAAAVQALPLTSKASDDAGLSIVALTWQHTVALSGPPPTEAIDPQVYMGLAPYIGSAHEDDYELAGGAP